MQLPRMLLAGLLPVFLVATVGAVPAPVARDFRRDGEFMHPWLAKNVLRAEVLPPGESRFLTRLTDNEAECDVGRLSFQAQGWEATASYTSATAALRIETPAGKLEPSGGVERLARRFFPIFGPVELEVRANAPERKAGYLWAPQSTNPNWRDAIRWEVGQDHVTFFFLLTPRNRATILRFMTWEDNRRFSGRGVTQGRELTGEAYEASVSRLTAFLSRDGAVLGEVPASIHKILTADARPPARARLTRFGGGVSHSAVRYAWGRETVELIVSQDLITVHVEPPVRASDLERTRRLVGAVAPPVPTLKPVVDLQRLAGRLFLGFAGAELVPTSEQGGVREGTAKTGASTSPWLQQLTWSQDGDGVTFRISGGIRE